MKLLLHICCGPCSLYPIRSLRSKGIEITGYFFNPNIHPFLEYERRVEALETVAEAENIGMIWDDEGYGLVPWLQELDGNFQHGERCRICYEIRLDKAARQAKASGFDCYSTTLLYSKYQNHDLIRQIGEEKANRHGVDFFYEDFRQGWQEGIDLSLALGIYRQPYCGCIFSEAERYGKRQKRLMKRLTDS